MSVQFSIHYTPTWVVYWVTLVCSILYSLYPRIVYWVPLVCSILYSLYPHLGSILGYPCLFNSLFIIPPDSILGYPCLFNSLFIIPAGSIRVRIIAPTARYSAGPLFRRPIIPTTHYSDSPLLRRPIFPTMQNRTQSTNPWFNQVYSTGWSVGQANLDGPWPSQNVLERKRSFYPRLYIPAQGNYDRPTWYGER